MISLGLVHVGVAILAAPGVDVLSAGVCRMTGGAGWVLTVGEAWEAVCWGRRGDGWELLALDVILVWPSLLSNRLLGARDQQGGREGGVMEGS